MISIRVANERGFADYGWLQSRHTFSFARYYDPDFMGYSVLRVINDDHVAPGAGFPTHGHRDMEIISYVIEGALEHKDNMGNGSVIQAGDIQRMTAGSGVTHSEFNASDEEPVNFLQIWIIPNKEDLKPGYEQKRIDEIIGADKLRLIASANGRDNSLVVHQDVNIYLAKFDRSDNIQQPINSVRKYYVHVTQGHVQLNDTTLGSGDGAFIADESVLNYKTDNMAELLLFDLP